MLGYARLRKKVRCGPWYRSLWTMNLLYMTLKSLKVKGLFIAMPSRRSGDGEFRDVAHPINRETRERFQAIVLERYERFMEESADEEETSEV